MNERILSPAVPEVRASSWCWGWPRGRRGGRTPASRPQTRSSPPPPAPCTQFTTFKNSLVDPDPHWKADPNQYKSIKLDPDPQILMKSRFRISIKVKKLGPDPDPDQRDVDSHHLSRRLTLEL